MESIDGLSGGRSGGQPVDWFYYVNGVEAPKGAAATNVHPGDHIWWDHHDWSQTDNVPAVVGSFPEPFLNGIEGKRLPVRIECATLGGAPCHAVNCGCARSACPQRSRQSGHGDEPETLRVLVGPWPRVAWRRACAAIEQGRARAACTHASPPTGGRSQCWMNRARATRTLTAAAGLVAATRYAEDAPAWMVTGTDDPGGVQLGARVR